MQHSDFVIPNHGTDNGGVQNSSSDVIASQIVAALEQGDHEAAGHLLQEAVERYPDDNRMFRLVAMQRKQAERFTRVYSLLKEARNALEDDAFVRGSGALREAGNLSRGFAALEEAVFHVAVDQSEQLGERNWRIARTLLEDADRLNPQLHVPERLWQAVRAAERAETIANVLAETTVDRPEDLERVHERLTRTADRYPDDVSLNERLKSVQAAIDDKSKSNNRQKQLRKLRELCDALQREEDPAEASKYVRLSETLAASYREDPDFNSVLDDVKHQVISSEKAAVALQQDRIDDCLEECAWVLSRMRQHQLFLKLKEKAEARELALVDEYSNSVSRIKAMLEAGQLAEADKLCSNASAKLPQFADLQELSKEIASRKAEQNKQIQETLESARRLVERGDRSLHAGQFRAAEQSFGNALKMLPEDKNLAGVVSGILLAYARAKSRENAESADDALKVLQRLVPGTAVPQDLTEALQEKREQTKQETLRWWALNRIGALVAQLESLKKREQITALRDEAEKGDFSSSSHADVKGAAAALFTQIDDRLLALDRKQARRPAVFRAISIAAAVILCVGLAYRWTGRAPSALPVKPAAVETAATIKPVPVPATGSLLIRSEVPGAQVSINGKEYIVSSEPLKVDLNADSYQVSGSRPGYKDFGPVSVSVGKGTETVLDVKLAPIPASLEIRGAEANTEVKLDGVLLGTAASRVLTKEVPPGDHSIELSRSGYLPRTITRTLAPGEVLALSGQEVQLESSEARTLASDRKNGNHLVSKPSLAALPKNPNRSDAAAAQARIEEAQWHSLDRSNPDALRAFVTQHPTSPWADQARKEMESVLLARETKAEENDWSSADHNNRAAIEDFLKKYPAGRHAPDAATALADLDRRARASEAQTREEAAWKKVNQHDEASLESYLRESPQGRYRNQAEAVLASLRVNQSSTQETAAVLTVLSRFANAWSARDVDSILAIQRTLNKREVRAELSQVTELIMRISPASPPRIEGSQAVVLCRRQASQTFSDGTRKQIPESIVSYVLAKREGNWIIEGTK